MSTIYKLLWLKQWYTIYGFLTHSIYILQTKFRPNIQSTFRHHLQTASLSLSGSKLIRAEVTVKTQEASIHSQKHQTGHILIQIREAIINIIDPSQHQPEAQSKPIPTKLGWWVNGVSPPPYSTQPQTFRPFLEHLGIWF